MLTRWRFLACISGDTGARLGIVRQAKAAKPSRALRSDRPAASRSLANALEILSSCPRQRILMNTLDHGPTFSPFRIRQPLRLSQHRAGLAQQRLNPRGPQK